MFLNYLLMILGAPGVIVHELAHAFFCLFFGIKIYKINLFQFKQVAGYVTHDEPISFLASFFISFGPLLVNSVLAIYLFTKIIPPYNSLVISNLYNLLWLYLGIVIGLQAIPSTGDAESLLQNANRNILRNPLKLLLYPLILVLYILNLLKRMYFNIVFVGFLFYVAKFWI
ncbi:MAG: DUF3267 domain-containing protein [Patescibacteria group bacterium]